MHKNLLAAAFTQNSARCGPQRASDARFFVDVTLPIVLIGVVNYFVHLFAGEVANRLCCFIRGV